MTRELMTVIMRVRIIVSAILIAAAPAAAAQETIFKFLVRFTDKEQSGYSVSNPHEFLSQRSIDRRTRQGIQVTGQDLPVSRVYIDSIAKLPLDVLYTSRWMNAAVIRTQDSSLAATLPDHSFISGIDYLYRSNLGKKSSYNKWEMSHTGGDLPSDHQIEMLQGHTLHQAGYKGQGMLIAVLDAGFAYADTVSGFAALFNTGRIVGTKTYVHTDSSFYYPYNGSHGANVLSIMGGTLPERFTGSAPEASFFLIQTEDVATEFRIEEANWLAGAELADSIGADIINTSLGYSTGFTDAMHDYDYSQMDGNTAIVTQAAELAASRGILVVTSAGNSGRPENPWGYVTAPADGDSVLAVGAVDAGRQRAVFSSRGPTYDGRVKPDVMAQGVGTWLIRTGGISTGNGTSYSSPVMAGLVACLWQKNPGISNIELIEALRASASLNPYPDTLYGYGIPNLAVADGLITGMDPAPVADERTLLFPNPADTEIILRSGILGTPPSRYAIYDLGGRLILEGIINEQEPGQVRIPVITLSQGTYVIAVFSGEQVDRELFIKL